MPVLIETLKDEDKLVGLGSALALDEIGEAKDAVLALIVAFQE